MIRWFRRPHAHITATAAIGESGWDALFDQLAERAHELDEEVTVGGSLRDSRHAVVEVLAFQLTRAAVDQLAARVWSAAARHTPDAEIALTRRCRCR
ncbi:MAG TPA: hypothetical protein VF062_23425 [Candidatus Limnocylindrales bacterium]